jgi:hypothetical protein
MTHELPGAPQNRKYFAFSCLPAAAKIVKNEPGNGVMPVSKTFGQVLSGSLER